MDLMIEGFTHHTTHTGELEIGYSVGPGEGPPLLLLHGVTSRRDGFVCLMERLSEHFRVFTMDQRGHGYSGHADGAYARSNHARDIRHVLDSVIGAPTIVWGHSMGGGNAAETVASDSSLIHALLLEDPALFGQARPPLAEDSPVRRNFSLFLRLLDEGATVDAMTAELLAQNPAQPARFARWKAECLRQMDVEILRNVVEGKPLGASDPAQLMESITCPVLLVQADPAVGGILADDYLAGICPPRDGRQIARLAGAGHNINRDHPDQLMEVAMPWLRSVAG